MKPALAIDIGGTKTLMTLVDGETILESVEHKTDRDAGPKEWISQIAAFTEKWTGRFDRAGITVTGLIKDNKWTSLNPNTLSIPGGFDLLDASQKALKTPVTLCNDAQAAAWGEYIHGAGKERDIVFMTISTGIGGGVILGGNLLRGRGGLAGHFGQLLPLFDNPETRFEDCASGRWIGEQGQKIGIDADARDVFAAAKNGSARAENIIDQSAARVARLAHNLQLLFDPDSIVVGGGVGLAKGYIQKLRDQVSHLDPTVRPSFVPAELGKDAGVIGVADLSNGCNCEA